MAINLIKLPKKPKLPKSPGAEPSRFMHRRSSRCLDGCGESLQEVIDSIPEGVSLSAIDITLEWDGYEEAHVEISWLETSPTENPNYFRELEVYLRKKDKYDAEMVVYNEKMKFFTQALNERTAVETAAKIKQLETELETLRRLNPHA